MPLASNIQPDGRFLGLFIGRSGGGKSAAAYSFPKPMKIYDLDGRIRGGLVPWIDRTGIEYEYFPPLGAKTVFEQMNDSFGVLQVEAKTNQLKLKTLILDSATWAVNSFLLDALPLTHKAGTSEG